MVEPADMVGPDSPVKGVTMKVAAYHSSNPSDPDVYHEYDDCPAGQQIPSWNDRAKYKHEQTFALCLSPVSSIAR